MQKKVPLDVYAQEFEELRDYLLDHDVSFKRAVMTAVRLYRLKHRQRERQRAATTPRTVPNTKPPRQA